MRMNMPKIAIKVCGTKRFFAKSESESAINREITGRLRVAAGFIDRQIVECTVGIRDCLQAAAVQQNGTVARYSGRRRWSQSRARLLKLVNLYPSHRLKP